MCFKLFAFSTYLLQKLFCIHLLSWKSTQYAEAPKGNRFTQRNVNVLLEYSKIHSEHSRNHSCILARSSISSKWGGGGSRLLALVSLRFKDNRPRWSKEDGGKALTLLTIFSFCQDDYPHTKAGKSKFNSSCQKRSLSPKLPSSLPCRSQIHNEVVIDFW